MSISSEITSSEMGPSRRVSSEIMDLEDNHAAMDMTCGECCVECGCACANCVCCPLITITECLSACFQHEPFCAILCVLFLVIGLPLIVWGVTQPKPTLGPTSMPTFYNGTAFHNGTALYNGTTSYLRGV